MKKEIIIWQIIILLISFSFMFIVNDYLQHKNKILANTNRVNCLIELDKNELNSTLNSLALFCDRIDENFR